MYFRIVKCNSAFSIVIQNSSNVIQNSSMVIQSYTLIVKMIVEGTYICTINSDNVTIRSPKTKL